MSLALNKPKLDNLTVDIWKSAERKVYEEDRALLEENFRQYINGFSKNVDDIIEHFNYRTTVGTMVKNNRLAPILNQYKELALGPDQLTAYRKSLIHECVTGQRRITDADVQHATRSKPQERIAA